MPLPYVGAAPTNPRDVTNVGYDTSMVNASITQTQVDSLLAQGFYGYVTKAYVDSQDALNATKAFIDTGDATRLHLTQIGAGNGVAGLDETGKVDVARVNVASTQRFPTPYLSPGAYNTAVVTTTAATESALFPPMTVADPGFTYRLLVTGVVDATSTVDATQWPTVRVRQGSATGQIVAMGRGIQEFYTVTGQTGAKPSGSVTIIPYYLQLQAPVTGPTTLYVMALKEGTGTGTISVTTTRPALMVVPVPA